MELKRLRMNSRVTQETLAGILGVSQPYISQIENDRVPIPQNIRDEYLAMFGD
jgi:transcriptional regulator with XRE-family HTH domain